MWTMDNWLPRSVTESEYYCRYMGFAHRTAASFPTPEEWSGYHSVELRHVLGHVSRRSPFYREKLKGHNLDGISPANIGSLPVTTKAELIECGSGILSDAGLEGYVYYETSGTTGRPAPCPRTWIEMFASNYQLTRNMEDLIGAHLRDTRPVVGILGPTEVHSTGDTIGDVFRNLNGSYVKFWPYSPKMSFRRTAELIVELGVNILFGTPSVIVPIIRYANECGLDVEAIQRAVKLVLLLGEVTSPAMRANISFLYGGAKCFNALYGGQETFVIGSARGDGRLHLARQNYVAEVLDVRTDMPVSSGEIGELVVTMLPPGIKPLIRYRTGDLVAMHDTNEPGGAEGCFETHGRLKDIVVLGGAPYFASDLEQMIMEGVSGVFGYQITITNAAGVDQIAVDIEPLLNVSDMRAPIAEIRDRLEGRLGIPCSVRLKIQIDPSVNTGGFISWKAARVVDERSPTDVEREAARKLAAEWLNGR
jgi:phenylacetate-CoA ligase